MRLACSSYIVTSSTTYGTDFKQDKSYKMATVAENRNFVKWAKMLR